MLIMMQQASFMFSDHSCMPPFFLGEKGQTIVVTEISDLIERNLYKHSIYIRVSSIWATVTVKRKLSMITSHQEYDISMLWYNNIPPNMHAASTCTY